MGTIIHLSIDTESFINLQQKDYFNFTKTLRQLCQAEHDIDYGFAHHHWYEFGEGSDPEWLKELHEKSRTYAYDLTHNFPGVVKVRWIKNDTGNVVSKNDRDIKDDENGKS